MPFWHISWWVSDSVGDESSQLQSIFRPVLSGHSFLLTAAEQFRNLTGFPIKPNLAIGYREVKRLYQAYFYASTAICRGVCAYLEISTFGGKSLESATVMAILLGTDRWIS